MKTNILKIALIFGIVVCAAAAPASEPFKPAGRTFGLGGGGLGLTAGFGVGLNSGYHGYGGYGGYGGGFGHGYGGFVGFPYQRPGFGGGYYPGGGFYNGGYGGYGGSQYSQSNSFSHSNSYNGYGGVGSGFLG